MYRIENFELSSSRVAAFTLKAGWIIRVTTGRLWLTVHGHTDDVWLHANESWTMPAVVATVWLSAEPAAEFQIAQAIAIRQRICLEPRLT